MNDLDKRKNDFLLELDNKYRGERVYKTQRKAMSANKEKISGDDNFVWASFFDDELYTHQKKLLQHIEDGKNAYLLSPLFSGKSTIALLTSLKFLFQKGKSIVYITSTPSEAKIQHRTITSLLDDLKFDWILEPLLLIFGNNSTYTKKEQMVPRLLITDISFLHAKILPEHQNYKYFFEYLGLIVLDGFETFGSSLRTNSSYVMRRLNRIAAHYDKQPQYLITSRPFLEARDTITRFIHVDERDRELKGVFRDNKEINEADIEFWVPPLDDVDLDYSDNEENEEWEFNFTRRDFFEEAYSLIIKAVRNGLNAVILHYGIPFSKHDKSNKARLIDSNLDNKIKNCGHYYIGVHPDNLRAEMAEDGLDWSDIHIIIFPGFEGSLMELRDTMLHIGHPNDTKFYIIFPQLPYYQFFVHHPQDLKLASKAKDLRKQEHYPLLPLDTEDPVIKKRHLLFFLKEKSSTITEIEKYFSDLDFIPKNYTKRIEDSYLLNDEGIEQVNNYITEEGKDLEISSLQDAFTLYVDIGGGENKKIGFIESFDLLHGFYPQAVVTYNNIRYRVSKIENRKIFMRTEDTISFTYPLLERRSKSFAEIEKTRYIFLNKITVGLFKDILEVKVKGYLSSKTLDIENSDPHQFEEDIKLKSDTKISGFFLKFEHASSQIIHTLSHLIFSSINALFPRRGKGPYFYYRDNIIYFYDAAARSKGVFQALRNEQILKDIFERSWRILKDCPCSTGCPGCLKIFECEKDNNNLAKKETFSYLGKLLDKEETTNKFISYKFGPGVNDDKRLNELKFKIFDIYKLKLDVDFNKINLYPEMFFSNEDLEFFSAIHGSLAGLCDHSQKKVWILPGLKEEELIEVFSHEYFHNWQSGNVASSMKYFNINDIDDENNLLYGCRNGFAKLFVEGQAVWASYKILDYFGLKTAIKSKRLSHYAEYYEGEKFVLFLEKKLCIPKLLEFIKNGTPPGGTNLMQYLEENYDKSGIDGSIRDSGRKKRNANELKCLGQYYLKKDRNLVRISYSLVLRDSQEPNSTKDLIEGEAQWLKELICKKIAASKADITMEEVLEYIKPHIVPIMWKHLKEAITKVRGSEPEKDFLPCKNCKSAIFETLEDTCILIKSIKYAERIKKEIEEKIDEYINRKSSAKNANNNTTESTQ